MCSRRAFPLHLVQHLCVEHSSQVTADVSAEYVDLSPVYDLYHFPWQCFVYRFAFYAFCTSLHFRYLKIIYLQCEVGNVAVVRKFT